MTHSSKPFTNNCKFPPREALPIISSLAIWKWECNFNSLQVVYYNLWFELIWKVKNYNFIVSSLSVICFMRLRLSYAPQCLNSMTFSPLRAAFSHRIYCKNWNLKTILETIINLVKYSPESVLWPGHSTHLGQSLFETKCEIAFELR